MNRLKVLLLIAHLGGDGAEQVTALLARGLSREKYEMHLGIVTGREAEREAAPHWVTVHRLGATRVRRSALPLVRLVREIEPDVILSEKAHLNLLVLLLQPFFPRKTRVLVRQNGTVSSSLTSDDAPRCTRLLYRAVYRRADRIICPSRAVAEDLGQELRIGEEQIAVLPNPADFEGVCGTSEGPDRWTELGLEEGPRLLAVGRLASENCFDTLLQAFATVRQQMPRASLIIAGTGPEEPRLKALCKSLGIEGAVRLQSLVKQPSAYYSGASVYVLSSRREGLPHSLVEALAGGLPVVAMPAPGSIADMLRAQPGTWLAPGVSVSALATTLVNALSCLSSGQRFQRSFSASSERRESGDSGSERQTGIR